MKIPLEWLKEYVAIKKDARAVADSYTAIGLMLDKPVSTYEQGKYKTEVLDLEHRMDRSDWLSIIGCARDYAAYEKLPLKLPKTFTKKVKKPLKEDIVDIKVMCPDLVRRFNTRILKNIKVKASPTWLKNRLEAYGIPSINNVVDATNYVMVEFGQPLHAQDLAKMRKREIIIRRANKDETLVTLLGENVKLDNECFVLTQAGVPTVLGGIVGGRETSVDENTTEIVLDAGNYNQTNIRKTSRRFKIQNETVLRCDKFLDPELTEVAINRAVGLILELAGGDVYENIDYYPKKSKVKSMNLRFERLEKLSGMAIDKSTVKRILVSLGYSVTHSTNSSLTVTVPYFRTDVEVEDDLVADVLRINGYSNIPSKLIDAAPPKEITPDIYKFEEKLRGILLAAGLHEHITDPLVPYDHNNNLQIKLENAQSAEKNALRTELSHTLANVINVYKRYGLSDGGVFEVGKVYIKKGADYSHYDSFAEKRYLSVVIFADLGPAEISNKIKSTLRAVLRELGIPNYKVKVGKDGYTIVVNGIEAGLITYDSFSLNTEVLLKEQSKSPRVISELKMIKSDDISIRVPMSFTLGDLYQFVVGFNKDILDLEVKVDKAAGSKYVLLTVKHRIADFSTTRELMVKDMAARFPDVEIR